MSSTQVDEVTRLADKLARAKGYISLWSMPFEKRMDFLDEAKASLDASDDRLKGDHSCSK